jgi:hypothetical protein
MGSEARIDKIAKNIEFKRNLVLKYNIIKYTIFI